jgi:hypothetical protein
VHNTEHILCNSVPRSQGPFIPGKFLESKKLVILPFLMAVFVFLNFFICKQSKNLTHTKWISGEKGNLICRRLKGKGYISLRRSLIHMRKISGNNSNLSLFRCFCYTSLDWILQVLYTIWWFFLHFAAKVPYLKNGHIRSAVYITWHVSLSWPYTDKKNNREIFPHVYRIRKFRGNQAQSHIFRFPYFSRKK